MQSTNRLSLETSPYLLQHRHNPVDWYPWGGEAFAAAERENKPIFLSVGYSTCYWCHVMERQSFENESVAAEMNKRFISIKVDREERPDVDQLYMTAVQVLTRQGGWPMSLFLTPDLRPFYGGTYFPPTDSYGRPGFVTLLRGIEDAYRNRRDEVEKTATQIVGILRRLAQPAAPQAPIEVDFPWIQSLVERSISDYDSHHGGFGGAPKFPRETLLELLLVYLDESGSDGARPPGGDIPQIRRMTFHTLDALAAGGIRDHLGGGFHRYSTDDHWLVPHFEIMLYNNAMLAWCYVEAYRQTNEPRYAGVARGILDFVLREMTSAAGAFYTAFDAEVDAMEGLSYLWTPSEIDAVLGAEPQSPTSRVGSAHQMNRSAGQQSPSDLFRRVYGVDLGPNFADPHHGSGKPDKNILFLPKPIETVAAELKMDVVELEGRLASMRQQLYAARSKRKQPLLDTKILTSWNALMIRAFAHAGRVLEEPRYLEAAERGAEFLLQHHRAPDGGLLRTSGGGLASAPGESAGAPKSIAGFLDDYAFLGQALLALDQAKPGGKWRSRAADLARQIVDRFGDESAGGFYFTDRRASDLIVRQKTASDSPLPSGNAAAALALLELGEVARAREVLAAFAQQTEDQGEAMSAMVQAFLLYLRRAEPFAVSADAAASSSDRPLSPQHIALGIVNASAEWENDTHLAVRLSILDGFHINAHDRVDAPLIATRLNVIDEDDDVTIDYPPGRDQRFGFAERPIRIYDGEVTISVRFAAPRRADGGVRLSVNYQACDESSCLPPMTKPVNVGE